MYFASFMRAGAEVVRYSSALEDFPIAIPPPNITAPPTRPISAIIPAVPSEGRAPKCTLRRPTTRKVKPNPRKIAPKPVIMFASPDRISLSI